jgi:hypothetical protein
MVFDPHGELRVSWMGTNENAGIQQASPRCYKGALQAQYVDDPENRKISQSPIYLIQNTKRRTSGICGVAGYYARKQ